MNELRVRELSRPGGTGPRQGTAAISVPLSRALTTAGAAGHGGAPRWPQTPPTHSLPLLVTRGVARATRGPVATCTFPGTLAGRLGHFVLV